MSNRHFAQLLLLGAIWGMAFMFMRVAAPAFGAISLAAIRIGLAALIMLIALLVLRQSLALRLHWKTYLSISAFNTAIPFASYCFAALHIPASYSAIANSTTPVWSALIAWLWFKEPLSVRRWLGIAFALSGVVALVGLQSVAITLSVIFAMFAVLIGAAMYAGAAFLIRRYLSEIPGFIGATGMVWGATLWLLLPGLALAPEHLPPAKAWGAVFGLAIFCTAAAYVLYFHLIRAIGPQRTSSVAFLFPVFATLWGLLFLSEPITINMMLGMILVLIGTGLVTLGHNPQGPTTQWEKWRDWIFWPLLYTFAPHWIRLRIAQRYQNGARYFREETNALRKHLPQWLTDADLDAACREQRLVRFIDRADVFLSACRQQHTALHYVVTENLPPLDRPLLLVAAHYGNGWWILPTLAAQGAPVRFISGPLRIGQNWWQWIWWPYLRLRWHEINRLGKLPLIEMRGASKQVRSALEAGGRVIALIDIPPALAARCSPVHFFGHTAWMPRQSIDIATSIHNAEVWTFECHTDVNSLKLHIRFKSLGSGNNPALLFQNFATHLESSIRQCPGSWHGWGDIALFFAEPNSP